MAKSHFQNKKRQKELERKYKKEQKRKRKLEKNLMESEKCQNQPLDENGNVSEKI